MKDQAYVLDHVRCTVLNSDYSPLSVVSAKRGLILIFEGKAVCSEEHPDFIVHSAHDIWPVPTQIILKEYVRSRSTHKVSAILTQRNLFLRDGYTCQYCQRHRSQLAKKEFLTRDHVIPMARGGKDTWTNVVAACNECNNKKGDRLLDEVGMKLRKEPAKPSVYELWSRAGKKINQKY